jgi:hypothetical protein
MTEADRKSEVEHQMRDWRVSHWRPGSALALLALQDQLAQSEGTVTSSVVRLYKALGGGWTSPAPGP